MLEFVIRGVAKNKTQSNQEFDSFQIMKIKDDVLDWSSKL